MTTKCFICLASCGRYCIIAVINYRTNQRGTTRSGIRFRHQPSKQLYLTSTHQHHYYAIFIISTFVCLVDERRFIGEYVHKYTPPTYLQLSSHSPCAIIIFSEQRQSEHDTFLACKLLYNWYNDFTIFENGRHCAAGTMPAALRFRSIFLYIEKFV